MHKLNFNPNSARPSIPSDVSELCNRILRTDENDYYGIVGVKKGAKLEEILRVYTEGKIFNESLRFPAIR